MANTRSSSYRSSKPNYSGSAVQGQEQQEPFFTSQAPVQAKKEDAFFQTKLSIGQAGDKFEKEADSVADKVVSRKSMDEEPAIQRQEISSIQRQEISSIQRQEISSIQRLATPLEDEAFSTNDERMKRDRELREKPEVQLKCAHCEEEEKHAVQKSSSTNAAPASKSAPPATKNIASDSLTNRIDSSRGNGQPLPGNTLNEMQSSFGRDLSNVNIHTDAESVNMNRELGAQAFTHGNDIYFNTGKFNPDSSTGKHLLAHELTHVVQQGGVGNIQRAPAEKHPAPSAAPRHPAPSSPPKTALPQAPPKAPELKPVALLTNDNHCGDMSFMINWELSKDAAAAGGYIIQEITIRYLVFDKFGRPVYREEKSPLHYYEAWRVLPNSKDMDPGSTDNFSFDIRTPDHNASTFGSVYFTAVAQYHDNVSPEEMPDHMVSGNKHTVAGQLLSSNRDPKLGGNVSKSVPHEFYFHWDCTKPAGDHTNVIDKQIP